MKTKFIFIILLLVLSPVVLAWTPSTDIDLRNYYKIYNGTSINATNFYQNGSAVLDENDTINLNVNSSIWWAGIDEISDLNDAVTIQGENISGGTIAFARLPSLTNMLTLDWNNITNKFITAVDNIYVYMSGTTATLNETKLNQSIVDISSLLNVNSSDYWDNLNVPSDLNDKITIQGENVTGGTIAFTRLPDLTNMLTLDWNNITNKFITAVDNIYVYMSGTTATFNETKLNETTDARLITQQSTLNVNSSVWWAGIDEIVDLVNAITLDWLNITNRPTHLSNFTDNLGDRGYTVLSNFTDDLGNRGYTHLSNFTDNLDYSIKNVNSSNYWDNLDVPADLNDKITIQGENISGGTIAFARLPSLTNMLTLDWNNITNKFITAISGTYLFMSGSTLGFNDTLLNATFQKEIGVSCSGGDFAVGVYDNGTVECETPAGGGDITAVETNGTFLYGGGTSGDLDIRFNVTAGVNNWGNFSAWNKDYGDLINTPTDLSNFTNGPGYITDLVNDTSPTLSGNLNTNGFNISNLDNISSTGVGQMYWNGSAWIIEGTTATLIIH